MTFDFDDMARNAPCGLLVTGIDNVVLEVNETFLNWTGYSRHDVVGREFHALLDDGSQALYATRFQAELWARNDIREVALTAITASGASLPILVNSTTIIADDRPTAIRIAVFDSTNRLDYERDMLVARRQAETSEARVRVLQEASTMFLAARTEAELGAAVSAAAGNAFTAKDVAVVTYDDDRVGFSSLVGLQFYTVLTALRASRPRGSGALRADEVLLIGNIEEAFARSEEVGALFRRHRAESLSAVPIADGDTVIGAFVCFFGRSRQFDQSMVDLQLALARQAGLAWSRVRLQEQLSRMALHDQLTGLANRALLDERASHALAASERSGSLVALIFIDLDGFKQINDELGHRAGDLVLRQVAERMNRVVREADIVGRFGGDEFLVVCDDADESAAKRVAERLRQVVRERIEGLPDGVGVTASIGIAIHDPAKTPIETADSLILVADAAMYASKKAGGDRVTTVTL